MKTTTLLVARIIASGFGSGYAPISPGTVGSIAACAAWALLPTDSGIVGLGLAMIIGLIGLSACSIVTRSGVVDTDPQWIVIDEWCGMWIALAFCSDKSMVSVATAFVLFRIFDISKVGPVGWAERMEGAIGIMLDDIVAGCCAALVLFMFQKLLLS